LGDSSTVFTSPRGWPTYSDEFPCGGREGLDSGSETRAIAGQQRGPVSLFCSLDFHLGVFVSSIPRARAVYWIFISDFHTKLAFLGSLIVTTKHQGRLGEEQGIWIATSAKLRILPLFLGATSPHNPPLNNATISTESQAFFCFWHLLRWYTRTGRKPGSFFVLVCYSLAGLQRQKKLDCTFPLVLGTAWR
jgi:hypothetical protein